MSPVLYIILCLFHIFIGIWISTILDVFNTITWISIKRFNSPKDSKLIKQVEYILKHHDSYRIILKAVLYINLSFLCLFIHSYLLSTQVLDPLPILISALLGSVLFLCFCEILWSYLKKYQWGLLRFSMPVLFLIHTIMIPFFFPILLFQKNINKWRSSRNIIGAVSTEEEIISLVEKEKYKGADDISIEDNERRMIRKIFDLDETPVREIMTHRIDIDALPFNSSINTIKKMIIETGRSRIPIYRSSIDEIIGIIYAKDLLNEAQLKRIHSPNQIMHEPIYIPESKNIDELLEEFKQYKHHMAVVIDEYGGTAGLVTIEDILEEIVGEIHDEYDNEEDKQVVQHRKDGSLQIDARTPIDKINEQLDLSISEEEDYDTIGGFVISQTGRIPQIGEELNLSNLKISILDADERKIKSLSLQRLDINSKS